MPTLATELRNRLKDTVIAARDVSEAGSRTALEAQAVHHHEPYGHMTSEERSLRKKLRAHARQLGDINAPFEVPHRDVLDPLTVSRALRNSHSRLHFWQRWLD